MRDPQRLQIAVETIVDPRLLAWAIRWYTEHPEHAPASAHGSNTIGWSRSSRRRNKVQA